MHEIECKKIIRLTDEDIDDIMCDALDCGIGYWCESVEVDGDYFGDYASEQISRGGQLLFHIEDDDEIYILTLEKFLKGVKMAVESNHFTGIFDENYDAETADVIIQYALFDEIIFG